MQSLSGREGVSFLDDNENDKTRLPLRSRSRALLAEVSSCGMACTFTCYGDNQPYIPSTARSSEPRNGHIDLLCPSHRLEKFLFLHQAMTSLQNYHSTNELSKKAPFWKVYNAGSYKTQVGWKCLSGNSTITYVICEFHSVKAD